MNENNFVNNSSKEDNSNHQGVEKTRFFEDKKNKVILEALIKEIKNENKKLIFWSIFSWLFFLFFLTLTVFFILKKLDIFSLEVVKYVGNIGEWLFLFGILIPGFIISLLLLIKLQLNKYRFDQEKKYHFQYRDEIDLQRVPNFIIEKYKSIHGLRIFINWFSFMSYLIAGLVLAFFILFRNQDKLKIDGIEISLADGNSFPDYENEIISTSIYMGVVFVLQIAILIWTERKKSQLMSVFDLNNRINHEDIRNYQKKIHILCFCVFLLPFFIAIILFWILRKVLKKK